MLRPHDLEAAVASGGMARQAAVSATTVGSDGIYMGLSRVPVGLRSSPHVHTNCESALYVATGTGRFLTGAHLETSLDVGAGDFIYVPPDAPHVVINDGENELVLIIARNTQEEVVAEYDAEAGAVAVVGSRSAPLAEPLLLNRCKSCRVPIRGPLAMVSRLRGIAPYTKNPQLCTRCEKRIHGAEEAVVTAMFADIRESTHLSAHMAREDYLGLLRRFFAAATPPIYDHYGVVDRFLGDGLLAFFNAPVVRERHVEDALQAALGVQRRLADASFGVGIGIETGLVTVGNPGLGEVVDFTCLGDAVNAASRLQSLAGAGEILIGPGAWPEMARFVDAAGIATVSEVVDLKGIGSVEVRRLGVNA